MGTVRHCQSKETDIISSYHEERENARNNARWRKTTHGLD